MGRRTPEPDDGLTFDFRKIRKWRRDEDIPQREFAGLVGTNPNGVLDWEHRRGRPYFDQIARAARILGVRLEDLYEIYDRDGNPEKLRRRNPEKLRYRT